MELKSKTFFQVALICLICYVIWEYYIPFYQSMEVDSINHELWIEDRTGTVPKNYDHDKYMAYDFLTFLHYIILAVSTIIVFIFMFSGELSKLIDPCLTKIYKWFNRRNEPNEK